GIRTRDAALEESAVELERRTRRLEQLNEDLLEREHAAAALAAIVESSGDAIIGAELDGTIVSWNDAARELYGYTAEEAVGANVAMLVPDDLRHELTALLSHVREGRRVERLQTERVTQDGRRLHVALTVSATRGPDGEVIGASSITR